MTVTYSRELSSIGLLTGARLLLRWKGSIFKVIYREAAIWTLFYGLLSALYRCVLKGEAKQIFESLCILCSKYGSMIPVTFILGFYVSIVFTRWRGIIDALPWVDSPCTALVHITGSEAKSKLYRRSIARYLVAAQVLALRDISMQVRKRFPTRASLVDAQLLTAEELRDLEAFESTPSDSKHWLPCLWAVNIVCKARQELRISSDFLANELIQQIQKMKTCNGSLLFYDWVNIPLVYAQLVSVAVWSYFFAALFGGQWLDFSSVKDLLNEPPIDLYLPIFTLMKFVCIVGWLRVAQNMLNPLGEGDDDVELNWIIDRNLQIGLLLADELHGGFPDLKLDSFMEEDVVELPHTAESAPFATVGMTSSCADDGVISAASQRIRSRAASARSSIRSKLSSNAHSNLQRSVSSAGIARESKRFSKRSANTEIWRTSNGALADAESGLGYHTHALDTVTEEGEARKISTVSAVKPETNGDANPMP